MTVMTADGTSDPNGTVNFRDSQTLLWATTILRARDGYMSMNTAWEDDGPLATECGLYVCLEAYNSTFTSSQLTETIVKSTSKKVLASWTVDSADPFLEHTDWKGPETLEWNPIDNPNTEGYFPRHDF